MRSYDGRDVRSDSPTPRSSRRNRSDSDGSGPISPPPTGPPRSALKDPNREGPRSRSRVRVSEDKGRGSDDSDTGSVVGQYVKHRDGRIDYMPSSSGSKHGADRGSGRPRDLEQKNDKSHHEFRQRRNGYESDEGDTLRSARRDSNARPSSRRFDDDDRSQRDDHAPRRRRPHPRGYQSDDDDGPARRDRDWAEDAALAGGGAAAAYGASRAGRRDDRRGGRSGDYDDDSRRAPPPRSSRRYDERGYDSERSRRGRYDDEPLPRRRGGASDRYGPSRYDDDARYDRRLPQRSKSARRAYTGGDERRVPTRPDGKVDWKKQGMGLFEEQLMPIIKKEGGRMAMKQLSKFLPS